MKVYLTRQLIMSNKDIDRNSFFLFLFLFWLLCEWMFVVGLSKSIYPSSQSFLRSFSHMCSTCFRQPDKISRQGRSKIKNLTFRPNVVSCHFHFVTLSARFANYLVWHYSRLIYPQHNFQMWRQKSYS